jgi:hypothetical protein
VVGKVVSVIPTKGKSLATVVLKRMCLPESTNLGRLASQNVLQIYEDYHATEVRVPVEQLVIVSRRIECGPGHNAGVAIASKIYRDDTHSWCPKSTEALLNGSSIDVLSCHRCGIEGKEMLTDNLAVTASAISCLACLVCSKKFGKSGTFLKSCRCLRCTHRHSVLLGQSYEKSVDSGNVCVAKVQMCSVCCLHCKSGILCNFCGMTMHKRCEKWRRKVDSQRGSQIDVDGTCCRPFEKASSESDVFVSACARLRSMRFSDFRSPFSIQLASCIREIVK